MSVQPPFGGGQFIADTSVWARAEREPIRGEWQRALANGQIAVCQITLLELLYSTQNATEYEQFAEELSMLRNIPRSVCSAALWAMGELAAHFDGYHRVGLPDYLVAACAQEAGLGVLHYDRDFDRLMEVLQFESRWAAPAGVLD